MHKNVLHINSYYLTNKLHYFFCIFSGVDNASYFIPVYKNGANTNTTTLKQGQKVYRIYSSIDKRLFFTKIVKCCCVAAMNYNIRSHQYIHAHTLFSDGLPAWLLTRLYRKKLVITVRNTDIHYYIRRSHLFRLIGKVVLANASQLFVPSHAYAQHLIKIYPFLEQKNNVKVLPNGVAPFWIKNVFHRPSRMDKKPLKLLFVGRIEKDKNLHVLIRYLQHYTIGNGIVLHIVGENRMGLEFEAVQTLMQGNSLVYHGKVSDENVLLEIYRSCDVFTLLSLRETFGISYIEAMTQSLPVIYSRGEGIDGFFSNGLVGYACDTDDIHELHDLLNRVMDNYEELSKNACTASLKFNWENIVTEYKSALC